VLSKPVVLVKPPIFNGFSCSLQVVCLGFRGIICFVLVEEVSKYIYTWHCETKSHKVPSLSAEQMHL